MKFDVRSPAVPYSMLPAHELKERESQERKTVVVFGVPRGGTTMMAGVVQRCGVWIGDGLKGNLEDQDFAKKPVPRMIKAIQERNEKRKLWGWKHPAAAHYLPDIQDELINPHYIIVWRDILATCMRDLRQGDITVAEALHRQHRQQAVNLRFARSTMAPFLFVSYERAIAHPMELADATAEFVGGHLPKDEKEFLAFMEPEGYKPVKAFDVTEGLGGE